MLYHKLLKLKWWRASVNKTNKIHINNLFFTTKIEYKFESILVTGLFFWVMRFLNYLIT
jgi:hypothetical protein